MVQEKTWFLQKFISLCDGTRRIEGVWKGKTKTYDMRGKKFAVVMAGNPYTESGEVFKIPDMLANRADIYNLGDVLGGMEDSFLMSYVENSLTSNPVLAPLATREMSDLYLLMEKAEGKDVSTNGLKHAYSAAEINEIAAVLQRLIEVRNVVYRVNKQYIASAAQDDRYRVEPPFKLQGSYRNMNKLTEKISPAMNSAEIQQLISDHYLGESQLLTKGAEENLLKLGELRGVLTDEQKARWTQIKEDFLRNKGMGGSEDDIGGRVVAQLSDISRGLGRLQQANGERSASGNDQQDKILQVLSDAIGRPVNVELKSPEPAAHAPAAPVFGEELVVALSKALSAGQGPLVEALRNSQQDQELFGQALLLIMERMSQANVRGQGRTVNPVPFKGPDSGASEESAQVDDFGNAIPPRPRPQRKKTEWDEVLERLNFNYSRDKR